LKRNIISYNLLSAAATHGGQLFGRSQQRLTKRQQKQ